MNLNIVDVESNDLYPYDNKIWVVVINKPEKGTKLVVHPYKDEKAKEKIIEFIFDDENETPIIAGHNILGFDLWTLWRNLDLVPSIKMKHFLCEKEVLFLDTLYMSRFLKPDMDGHSLELWGVRLGEHKMDFRQALIDAGLLEKDASDGDEFKFHSDIMDIYCIQDTATCSKLFYKLYQEIISTNQYNQYLLSQWNFWLMNAQSFTGFQFDRKLAEKLKEDIEGIMQKFRDELEPTLPSRPLKKAEENFYSIPKKPYKKDGSLSNTMLRFLEKTGSLLITDDFFEFEGKSYNIKTDTILDVKLPMLLDDQQHMKAWFLTQGWEPTYFNFKKDKKGKTMRDENFQPITTTPKLQENGKICPNLLKLEGDLVKEVVKYLSYKNRYSVLKGWLEDKRLDYDGRISASFSGITPTYRIKHTSIVNVPKAQDDVILGKEFRSLFTSSPTNTLIGCDQSALEARCEAHWVYNYDPKGAKVLLEGDIHSINAKAFFPNELKEYDITLSTFDKDEKGFKPYRSLAKNGKYAVTYGATGDKLATTLRKQKSEGKKLFDAFWKANPGLKKLKDFLINQNRQYKFIYAIDGRRLHPRSEHSIINLLIQSTGSIVMEVALILFDMEMGEFYLNEYGAPYYLYKNQYVSRVGFFHDEVISDSSEEISLEIGKIMENCMKKSGKVLKMNFPLEGQSMYGKNWCETH